MNQKNCSLTPRQLDVLRLIALNKVNKAIAETLCISVKTVGKHRDLLNRKLVIKQNSPTVCAVHFAQNRWPGLEDELPNWATAKSIGWSIFTKAEKEVISLFAQGLTVKAIAVHRGRAFVTVVHQRDSIYGKLKARVGDECHLVYLTHLALTSKLVENMYAPNGISGVLLPKGLP